MSNSMYQSYLNQPQFSENDAAGRFLNGMMRFVLQETAVQHRQIKKIWAKPLPVRVADGYAIENVTIVKSFDNGQIELVCGRNQSRFRAGDILVLSKGNPAQEPRVLVNLDAEFETTLRVSSATPFNWGNVLTESDDWVLDIGYLDLSSFFLNALAEAGDTVVGRDRILPLLMGRLAPNIDPGLYDRGLEMGEALGLNWSQSEALANAYATDLVYLIQGPPGTGKTRVLAHLAQALVSDGERVLVTSFTHRAINNALNKLAEVAPDVLAVKIGQESVADDLLVENYKRYSLSPLVDVAGGYVIGGTPFATCTKRLSGVEFDTIIFDEASQVTLPLAVMGMLRAKKYIFIGDQQQLPPVLTTRYSGGAFRESVFSLLVDQNYDTMLTETYRLNEQLTEWPSEQFYEGLLTSAAVVADLKMEFPTLPNRLETVLDVEKTAVFYDIMHHNNTTSSYKEANAVVELVQTVVETGFPAHEIGIVTPYRAQARLIRSLLRKTVSDDIHPDHIVTDTVERMQGQERDLIILSLTTSNPRFAADLADFFFQPERLNVAITRPRRKLIIVGSRHVLDAKPNKDEHKEFVQILGQLLKHCAYVPYEYG
ncbi:MAG: DNA helicase [Chloroflexi bacterium]|nr:MAG: DNA helicase [Chloroflexota bacterium]